MFTFNRIFDCLSTAVLVFGRDDRCLYINESCESLLLRSRGALSGKTIRNILGNDLEIIRHCGLARQHAQSIVLREIEIYLPDWQRQLLVDLTISPCSLEGGDEGLLLELVDRKDVHKLSHDTDMLARFKVATQIVRGLAHEIKNPLGGIRGAAQLLALEMDGPEAQEYTSVIIQEVDRLSELLNRMSGGNTSFERKQLDIHEPLTRVAELLKAEHGELLEFEYNFDTSLPSIEMNFDQLKQALLNLMKNAAQWSLKDHQPGTGNVNVMIKTRAAHPDLMRSLMPQRGVRIQIVDNGPGVDETIINQLFLPMVSRREGGTGLGLSISQEIAQNHGGFIELDEPSKQGGTSFSLYLPYIHE
jgi:two-component system nitrogen regulation sensor histidine kinase GlnL